MYKGAIILSTGNYKDWRVGAVQEIRQQTLEVATKLHVYNQPTRGFFTHWVFGCLPRSFQATVKKSVKS